MRRQPTIEQETQTKRSLILGLDDGSAFAVLHPSIRPPCVLHSPASVLRTTQPEFPRPTRRQRGLASGRNRGTRRGRDNSLAATLHCCSVRAAWESRACAITSAHEPTQSEKGGTHRGSVFAADVLQHRTISGFVSGLTVCFSLNRLSSSYPGFRLPLIRASASQSTSRTHARPSRKSNRQ